jgi:hypothetical protein
MHGESGNERVSSGIVVIRLRAEKEGNWGSVSGGGGDICLRHEVQISFAAHTVSYGAGTEISL